jgi:phosphoserine phosphatase
MQAVPERVDAPRLVELLESTKTDGPTGLAFDADGTLWSGDVGEDVFEFACGNALLREPPREALARLAGSFGFPERGSSSELALSLYAGYRRGEVPELLMCEIMTWAYAGFGGDELGALAREALIAEQLPSRARPVLNHIFDYARSRSFRTVVISASPRLIVVEGLRLAGIEVDAIGAAEAAHASDRIEPGLLHPVPYGPEKPVVGARLLRSHDWLASFGDNAFDVEMLKKARIGVAVFPKPALVSRLGELSNTVVLE